MPIDKSGAKSIRYLLTSSQLCLYKDATTFILDHSNLLNVLVQALCLSMGGSFDGVRDNIEDILTKNRLPEQR